MVDKLTQAQMYTLVCAFRKAEYKDRSVLGTIRFCVKEGFDPDKRCIPPEFKYGQWWPRECPNNDEVYQ